MEFTTFNSSINPSFWNKYTELKLDVDKLNENERNIWGYYTNLKLLPKSILEVDSTSFNNELNTQNTYLPAYGVLLNKNTIEEFKNCDKTKIIQNEGNKLWNYIESGEAIKNPSILNRFLILSFVDLKKYHYYYWFAFPVAANINYQLIGCNKIVEIFNDTQLQVIGEKYNQLDICQKAFFVITNCEANIQIHTFETFLKLPNVNSENIYFAISDSSNDENPCWMLRNYMLLILNNCNYLHASNLKIIALRLTREQYNYTLKSSILFNIKFPNVGNNVKSSIYNIEGGSWIGWERNERGKLGPKMSNMKNSMDPKCVAESAVDLNLKLMKWRLLPDIDLEKIKTTKCLLLGSGTLGCSVARNLLAWGVRKITFVDNSTVSYSNPVRQSLFTFNDCIKNLPKAEAAATNLKQIFPGVESVGHQLSVPMPGHPIGESLLQQTVDNVDKLTELINEHDVIFILMDSRESRWLPTLLGNALQKIVINAALGFDTFLVMRHGCTLENAPEQLSFDDKNGLRAIPGNNLGCYFCNDITAPGNSLKDRTLDQQCTVTRPGISNITGAIAVELLISILQHKYGACAPAYYKFGTNATDEEIPSESLLGILPHSIRGFLSNFNQVLPATKKYEQCTACSDFVLTEYKQDGFKFLLKAFNNSKYLEEITGLDKLQTDDIDVWDLSDSGED